MDSPSTSKEWPRNALPKNVIEWLFDKMLSKWGKQFVDRWAIIEAHKLQSDWGKALYGLTELEFRRGVAKLDSFDFPPSQPEFLKACRPEVNAATAYYEALDGVRSRDQGEVGTWSHPAIFWAVVRVSAHDLKNQTYSQIRSRWEMALNAEMGKGQWDAIPAPFLAIAAPKETRASKEKYEKILEDLKRKTEVVPKKNDSTGWAKSILARQARGDKTLLPIQVQFARDALHINGEKDEES